METTDIFQKIDSQKKRAEDLQPVNPELEKVFWDKFRLEFNYNSNHLEGNTLTYGHTQLLLLFDKVGGDYSLRELEEMKAHDVALKLIKEAALDPEHILTEKFIKEINETILVRPYYNEAIAPDGQPTKRLIQPGQYKQYPNSVRLQNGEMFHYSSPEETPAQMGDLMDWYTKETENKELHSVQIAALFHYRFVRIHPFDDSNGRTARLMMNYILMKNNFASTVVESVDKKNYLIALNRADTGDIEAFVKYITNLVLKWQGLYLKALKGEEIEEEGDFEKEVELLKKSLTERDKIKQTFARETVISLFTDSLFSLLKKIINKLSLLEHFFYTKEIRFGFNGSNSSVKNIEGIKQVFEEQKNSINQSFSIDLRYLFKGLSTKKTGVVDYYTDLKIKFNEFTYQINLEPNGEVYLEKKYNEFLSEEEAEEIISTLSKKALKYIKDHMQ